MYDVEWTDAAAEDLYLKAPSDVAEELLAISRDALDLPPSQYGGPLGDKRWRRGVSRQRQKELDAVAGTLHDLDRSGPQACDYILVYQERGVLKSRYRVLAVISNGELAAAVNEYPNLDTPPWID
ncbi:hypothetical protein AB0G02_02285 [Actinosynnema sp. NPDC023658]|uniref:hypothetical protein n=1 Tax=Actinosynnema sp. NPDC023658 TaxID=3155465 RepID=UPI0033F08821